MALPLERFGPTAGAGCPLVLLHGFAGTKGDWQAVRAALGAQAHGACLSLPGHEGTAEVDGSFVGVVDHLARIILAAFPRRPVHLVGYSLGARLALGLLLRHPELCARATLVGVHPGLRLGRAARARADAAWAARLAHGDMATFWQAWLAQPLFASQRLPGRVDPAVAAAWAHRRLRHDPLALGRTLLRTSLSRMPYYLPLLPHCECPVDFVAGREDNKFFALAQQAQARTPRSRLQLLDACGHNALLEAPTALAACLSL